MKSISILLIICITLFGLFGVFVISTKKGDKQANMFLGLFFILWAFDFLDGLLMFNGVYLEYPDFALWSEAFVFLYGPILYFYTVRILKAKSLFNWKSVTHFVPFIFTTILIMVSFHLLSRPLKIEVLNKILTLEQSPSMYLMIGVVCIHFSCYIFLSKKEVAKTEKELSEFYSNYNIQWLSTILNSLLIILLISVLANLFQINQSYLYFDIALPILIIVMTLFILSVFWKSLNEPFVWLKEKQSIKYEASKIVLSEKETIAKEIVTALEDDKIYLNPDLTLKDLSEKIGYGNRIVSQVINEVMDKSFFNLINTYRIEEAKRKLRNKKDSKQTVLEVMYQVGFNSKSSFNTQFKKQTGLTPTEFINSI